MPIEATAPELENEIVQVRPGIAPAVVWFSQQPAPRRDGGPVMPALK